MTDCFHCIACIYLCSSISTSSSLVAGCRAAGANASDLELVQTCLQPSINGEQAFKATVGRKSYWELLVMVT